MISLLQGGVQLRLDSAKGPLIARNAQHHTAQIEGDVYRFRGTGSPVIIERPWQGAVLSANQVDAEIRALADQTFVVQQGSFVGSASVVTDSDAADAALKAAGKPLPSRTISERTEVSSDRFNYSGTEQEGTLVAPGALTTTDASHGTREVTRKINGQQLTGPEAFEQKWTLVGSSGTVAIDPGQSVAVKQRLRKGDLNGPVTLHLTRSAKGPGDVAARLTAMDASADHVAFDFTGATRTITATGHVVLTSDNGVFKGTVNADKAVVTVDENLNVKTIDTTGEPTTTTIHRLGGGK